MSRESSEPRSLAARVLAETLEKRRALDEALAGELEQLADPRDRRLTQGLCYGVMRYLPRLRAILHELLRHPIKNRDRDVEALLLLGLYQYLETRVPEYAATTATVNAARTLGKPWAGHLINGVLRNFQRKRAAILEKVDADPARRLGCPPWLWRQLGEEWPGERENILLAGNRAPALTLRVNTRRQDRETYRQMLGESGLEADPVEEAPQALRLREAVEISRLPGFAEGRVSVQDAAAQQAALLLDTPPGARVLDACAAPGGKTAHILELQPTARMLALDSQAERLASLRATLDRLELAAEIRRADASRVEDWWDGEPFQRILLDAPCSGSGVTRRHPDIKYLRRADDLPRLAARQQALLNALWPLLAPGGKLVYATCSLFAVENRQQVEDFLNEHEDAEYLSIPRDWGHKMSPGWQILPGEQAMDGFYYACLAKR